jgi:hypothetical protein
VARQPLWGLPVARRRQDEARPVSLAFLGDGGYSAIVHARSEAPMLLRSLLLAAIAAWSWSADATPDAPARAAAAAPAAKPLPDSVEPELAKQAMAALREMGDEIELAHKAREDGMTRDKSMPRPHSEKAGAAAKRYRELQFQCLTEFFADTSRRKVDPKGHVAGCGGIR